MERYSHFLDSRSIFIDPGHGGELDGARFEAILNLKVARYLRSYFEIAGARTTMSREGDWQVALSQRVAESARSGAELFISIHHNASSDKEQLYCSTWYHSREGQEGYDPRSHDIARYIQRDLASSLRLPGSLVSFDGTLSDYEIYEGVGFSVLRDQSIPSVLVECTFVTNEKAAASLGKEEFNRIEAWGIFTGVARYFEDGEPSMILDVDTTCMNTKGYITIRLSGLVDVDESTVQFMIDSQPVMPRDVHYLASKRDNLRAMLSLKKGLRWGRHDLEIWARNVNGNHCTPLKKPFWIKP